MHFSNYYRKIKLFSRKTLIFCSAILIISLYLYFWVPNLTYAILEQNIIYSTKSNLRHNCGVLTLDPQFIHSAELGNLMFLFASIYAIARQNNRTLLLPKTKGTLILHTFRITKPVLVSEKILDSSIMVEDCCKYYEVETNELPCGPNFDIVRGYLHSWKYFHPTYEEEIRRELSFLPDATVTAKQRIKNIFKLATATDNNINLLPITIVGVHTRRGNIRETEKWEFGRYPTKADYILKAMHFLVKKLPQNRVVFLILGSNFEWNKARFMYKVPGSHKNYIIPGSSADIDMATLSLCNHSIFTTGTYGWWAAYLAGGITIYQKEFAKKYSNHYKEYDTNDYFLPEWVAL